MKFDGVDIDAIHHKMTVKQQKEHYDKFARFGCILCYYLGYGEGCSAELHHIRTGNIPRKQAPVIPLCPEHHRGNTGVHGFGSRKFERTYNITQQELLFLIQKKISTNP